MAKGKKTGGKNFEPDNKAAVGHGRPRLTEKERQVREALNYRLAYTAEVLNMPRAEAIKYLSRKDATPIDDMLLEAIKKKDKDGQDYFIKRMIGGTRKIVEETIKDERIDLSKLSDKELEDYERLVSKASDTD